MPKSALVTGHLGFVGRHMMCRLIDDGWDVIGIDIADMEALDAYRFFEENQGWHKHELVIHCAANIGGRAGIDSEPMFIANNLALDAAFLRYVERNSFVKRAVYFSSSAVYPVQYQTHRQRVSLPENAIRLHLPQLPDSVYGWAKLTGEMLVQKMSKPVHVFRPFSGYGADQDLSYPFPMFAKRAMDCLRGESQFAIWGDGKQVRDWVHIDDIVNMVMAALELDAGTWNICTGVPTSMMELARMMLNYLNVVNVDWDLHPNAPTGVEYRVGDPKHMLEVYTPQVTLREGISRAFHAL